MKNINKLVSVLAFAAVFGAAAQAYKGEYFVNRPGYTELSGTMMVRPVQLDQLRKGNSINQAMQTRLRARARLGDNTITYYPEVDEYVVKVPNGLGENEYSQLLMATGDYEYVEPNWTVYPQVNPNDPRFNLQWAHPLIQSPQAWDITTGDPNMIVALTDTGIDLTHADLQNRVPGYNAVDNKREVDGGQVNDLNGHGTHTSGIAAAAGNNGIGVVGAGWNFKIMMIRVSNSSGGGSSIAALTNGARWAADNGAKVISTSYSGVSTSSVQTTGVYVNGKGANYFWAAGNDGANLSFFDWANVVIVGASTQNDSRASFSAYGKAVDVFAPGVSIQSSYPPNSYANLDGTSMATPLAAGVIALIRSKYPNYTVAQAEDALFNGCKDLGTPGNDDTWGWGRINSFNSVNQDSTTQYNPTNYNVFRGIQTGGSLSSLFNSDDNYLVMQNGTTALATEAPITLIVESVAPNSTATILQFKAEMKVSIANLQQEVDMYDFAANAYAQTDTRSATTSDQTVLIDGTNVNRYIESGTQTLRARIRVRPVGALFTNTWYGSVDQAVWLIK